MNRQTTALIFILSLLAVFVTNTMADGSSTEKPAKPPVNINVPAADPPSTAAPPTDPPADPSADDNKDGTPAPEGSGDAADKSAFAYSAFGAFATALLANFF
ncbi:hypothetical protein CAEBREN_31181 [Caenorhabditis brenneri]|uniref:Uncharacterized protein n=1 Tax=Caenorhabditis brenneri TaxID=135651 RepID=G0MIJ9_CAEBE|nr:hypothetical protein CAEBREN_31181 [Caenorhabditis brenneri]